MRINLLHAACGLTLLMTTAGASAVPVFFEWTDPTTGAASGISATVNPTVIAGDLSDTTFNATDPTFVASYGSDISILLYNAPATSNPGDVQTEISFSEALPANSLLLVIDVDWDGETVTLGSDLGFLSLLEQGETATGATSEMPVYDGTAGTLSELGGGINENEYSLFDVSGVTSLSIDYSGGSISSGSGIAIAIPATPRVSAPAPATAWLLGLGLVGWMSGARRFSRRQGRQGVAPV